MSLSRRRLMRVLIASSSSSMLIRSGGLAWQDATPDPVPEELRGAGIAYAAREFEYPGLRFFGPMHIGITVNVLDSPEHASVALQIAVDRMLDFFISNGLHEDSIRPASTPKIGEEELAYVGESMPPDEPDRTIFVGFYAWRNESIVFVMYAAGLSGDQLPELFSIARAIDGRPWADLPVSTPTSSRELHKGGAWDLLPTLADVPEGFVLKSETDR